MGWNVQLPDAEYCVPDMGHSFEYLVNEVNAQPAVAIDTETDGLTLWKCLPHYWSISWADQGVGKERRITMPASTLPYFMDAFRQPKKKWVFANAKFDAHMLANFGIDIAGKLVDTQVMHALLYEEQPHGLKDMARQLLGWKWTDFQETFGSLRKGYCTCGATNKSHADGTGYCKRTGCAAFRQVTALDVLNRMAAADMAKLVDYASNDAYATWKLYKLLDKELMDSPTWSLYPDKPPFIQTMHDYFWKIEMPFTKVLFTCERNGVKVDKGYLEEIAPGIQREIMDIRKEIVQLAGYMLNPNSPPQLADYFFVKLGLKPKKFTKGGKTGVKNPSTDAKYLESIEDDVPMAALLLKLRKVEKQYGTYIEEMPTKLDQHDRVHMKLNQDVARTGRLSSSEPNMQNIPTGDKDIYNLRKSFICEPGNALIVVDYKALEMRLLAAASQEEKMCQIFWSNKDVHMGNAELVFDIPYADLVKAKKIDKLIKEGALPDNEMTAYVRQCLKARGDAKTIGFGLNYGMKEKKLARDMGCSVEEAVAKINQYMATYPAVRQFFKEAVEDARSTGFAFTLLGRRRRLSSIWSNSEMDRWQAERQATNMPIQGTAADVCKMAMILLHEDTWLRDKYDLRMLLQVHDELVFECPKEAVPEVTPLVKEWMEHPFPTDLMIALEVDIGSGPSWGNAK